MRVRPLAALSVAVAAVLALSGCAGSPDTEATTATPAALDLCADVAPSGDASDAIQVSGEVGVEPTVSFTTPIEVEEMQRTVVVEGTGDTVAEGDYVTYAVAAYDAQTGELLESAGFSGSELAPAPIVAGSVLGAAFGCAPVGTRVAAVTAANASAASAVYVIDLLAAVPADEYVAPVDETCQPVAPADGAAFPSVTWKDDEPTVTVPAADPPTEVTLQVLSEGDGEVVEAGDSVTVDYQGVKWSDGTIFDSSWERGSPATFVTTGVVAGFGNALIGQKVGSQLLVAIPPACGYGGSAHELAQETLVFVITIEGTEHPAG